MNSKGIRLLLAGVTACISLTFFITPTPGTNIIIGGNTTDIGTIIFVSPKPGDSPTMAGTALLNLVNGITDNSADNPYLIKLGPGIYDIGANSLQMKQYVDIEGSGEHVTKITGVVSSPIMGTTIGTVNGADKAEIRFLTVENTFPGSAGVAAFYNLGVSPTMTHLTINVNAQQNNNGSAGVYNISSSPTMTNVTISASSLTYCTGMYNSGSSPTITNVGISVSATNHVWGVENDSSSPAMTNLNVTVSANDISYGIFNSFCGSIPGTIAMQNVTATTSGGSNSYGMYNSACQGNSGTVSIDRSTFSGTTNSIFNNPRVTLKIGASKLVGLANIGGTYLCVGVYDGTGYTPLNMSCGCDAEFAICANSCVNLTTDPNNCGLCGNVCGTAQTCLNSICH